MAAADDFYLKHGYGGHFGGRTLIQAHGKIGGHRSVFINLVSGNKDAFVYPPLVVLSQIRSRVALRLTQVIFASMTQTLTARMAVRPSRF